MNTIQDFEITTDTRTALISINETVCEAVRLSGIVEGICLVSVPHTTAGVLINENADPDVAADILEHFDRMVPVDPRFRHGEGNSAAHIKAVLTGSSVSLPIRRGEVALGTWQGFFFAEFDGPRTRRFSVSCFGEKH